MKIITEGWPKENEVLVGEIKITYVQNPDNCSGEDDIQELTLETRDGGGGKYINFKTGEHGWSVSNENELISIFNHFRSLYENTDNSGRSRS